MSQLSNWTWHEYATPVELADALAAHAASELRTAAADRGEALLAVSGGMTPKRFLQALSEQSLPWRKVTVTLVDERFVDTGSDRSNEKMVRSNLMRGEAAQARFIGLSPKAPSVEDAAKTAGENLSALPLPFDVAVLGMGLDGHTASFFPDAANLDALLDPESREMVLPVHAESAGEPRLTLSLTRLVETGFVALHIEGKAKRDLLLEILRDPANGAPVKAVFRHSRHPVHVYWAPNEDEIP